MSARRLDSRYQLKILEDSDDLKAVEDLQRLVWTGSETEIVPMHMLMAAVHNGGLIIGAYEIEAAAGEPPARVEPGAFRLIPAGAKLVGFVFGFPGLYFTPDGPRPKHCSHMMGVHPDCRDQGIGFALKRAQWQMVRHQELDRITWTFDPLLSRNAHLNIARLGAVCNTYRRDEYGQLRDGLNVGLPSDRFQVDWWVRSERVFHRLSQRARGRLNLAHFQAAGVSVLNPAGMDRDDLPRPDPISADRTEAFLSENYERQALVLVEIPADFLSLKDASLELGLEWRMHTRSLFEALFEGGYLVTDFVYLPGATPRSYYILSYGESTL
jgi:predicted GNAT superfamily acetyltransferase